MNSGRGKGRAEIVPSETSVDEGISSGPEELRSGTTLKARRLEDLLGDDGDGRRSESADPVMGEAQSLCSRRKRGPPVDVLKWVRDAAKRPCSLSTATALPDQTKGSRHAVQEPPFALALLFREAMYAKLFYPSRVDAAISQVLIAHFSSCRLLGLMKLYCGYFIPLLSMSAGNQNPVGTSIKK